MALTEYVIMPGEDYQAVCDAVRAKTGKTEALKSGDLSAEVAQIEVDDGSKEQLRKLVDGTIEGYVFPEDVTMIREGLFWNCKNLTSVEMHERITVIGEQAFYNTSSLILQALPESTSHILVGAFKQSSIFLNKLPSSLQSISKGAFQGSSIYIKEFPLGLTELSPYAFADTNITELFIHSNIIKMDDRCCGQNEKLTSVIIEGNSQLRLVNSPFSNCPILAEVTFLGPASFISTIAFQNCPNLTTINVPWSEGEVANAPWGATNATINYNYIPPEEPEKVKIFNVMTRKHATIVSDLILGVSTRLDRGFLYSAATHDRIFMGQDYSPIKIPNGAVYAKIIIPSDMNHAVLICENHPTETRYVNRIHDGEWRTDGIFDVSGYADGEHYIVVKIGYISGGEIPEDFDSNVIDFYFTDANGNVIEPDTPEETEGDET